MLIQEINPQFIICECEEYWERTEISDSSWLEQVIIQRLDNDRTRFSCSFVQNVCSYQKIPFIVGKSFILRNVSNASGKSIQLKNFKTHHCASSLKRLDGDSWCPECGLRDSVKDTHSMAERQNYPTLEMINHVDSSQVFTLAHGNGNYKIPIGHLPDNWRLKRTIIEEARQLLIASRQGDASIFNPKSHNKAKDFCAINGLVYAQFFNHSLAHGRVSLLGIHGDLQRYWDQAECSSIIYLGVIDENTGDQPKILPDDYHQGIFYYDRLSRMFSEDSSSTPTISYKNENVS